jgi:Spy/CpxP family protein refolding chaperone
MGSKLLHIIILVLVIIVISAAVRVAHDRWFPPRPDTHREPPDLHSGFVREELGLTDQQVQQFEALVDSFARQTEPIRDSLHQKRTALFDEMSSDEPSLEVLDGLAEDIGNLEIRLKKRTIRHMLEHDEVLTPEQKSKLVSAFRERHDRMGRPSPHHRPMGRGFKGHQSGSGEDNEITTDQHKSNHNG